MIKSSDIQSNRCLRWLSAHLLIGLVLLSSFLAHRFGNIHIAKNASSSGDVIQVFFADQADFAFVENISISDTWARSMTKAEPIPGNLILFSGNEEASIHHLFQLKKSYLSSSLLIRPGLLLADIIYPFHSYW